MTHDPLLLALIGHLVGDYILQNDWQALNKKNSRPGPKPCWTVDANPHDLPGFRAALEARNKAMDEYPAKRRAFWMGRLACLVHCLIWATCVCLFAGWGWAAFAFLFATHFVQDRTGVIRWWMKTVGQEKFATGPCSPWSIIVVDNVWHVLQIYTVARWFP